ncbi:MAG: sugar ABC transporter ATP-binding protein [Microbacterium sp.]|uniref:sugar ABC transporter ATP-binding protein n=1 Tax=Microbacterium sp. TaxID=51671 RepID=UPI001ACDDAD1|nr:sugar ABC transporter ATP-binding protein [Microbacterium sp.]MBN9155781.1 sugar ABC transporter ATP-binding protein [Microbacterium sp.]
MPASAAAAALEIRSLSKTFPGGRGLIEADLVIQPGTVHALLGQNGSGKSTLIKVLAGVYQPDPGATASVHGESFDLGSAAAADAHGIRFIHQDLGLVSSLDVTDNLRLGRRYASRWWLSDRKERRIARDLLQGFGVDVDTSVSVGELSQARQTMVAIARALSDGDRPGRLIVLDEPTASLQREEVRYLFELIERLRDSGNSILYVTHRLEEVFEIADDVTVLRDGRNVVSRPVAGLDHDSLVELIIGRPLEAFYPDSPAPSSQVVLRVQDLSGPTVHDVSFDVHQGEILGIAGLLGSGYEELLFLMAGGEPRDTGTIELHGRPIPSGDPGAAIRAGLAFAPADRKRLSAIPAWSLRENLTLPALAPLRNLWLSDRSENRDAAAWLDRVQVRFPPSTLFSLLSGGNQQRVVLARWLRTGASVMLLQEPTNGVDTGAKHAIYSAIEETLASGTAVVISSSDAEELCAICDRVIVMNGGRIGVLLEGAGLTVERLLVACMKDSSTERNVS